MPTYDYQCEACDHAWEEFQSITSKPTKKCPECGKSKAKRKIGPGAGIIFKGSGFYQTDYRSDSYKKAADADSKSQKGPDSKSETKSESKSESKSDSKPSAGDSGGKSSKAKD
jgi:putative FmdB family regulatory protein